MQPSVLIVTTSEVSNRTPYSASAAMTSSMWRKLSQLRTVAGLASLDNALIGSRSQTFGKMALGIKVVDADSRAPIGYVRAFRRWLSTATLRALFTIPTIVDHLWPLRDRKNQTLHDKFARSVVVRT